jgi:hypothetical protein
MFAVFAMISALSAMFRQSSASGEGDGENDRQECFHSTKVFVADRSRAFTRWSSRLPSATRSFAAAHMNAAGSAFAVFAAPKRIGLKSYRRLFSIAGKIIIDYVIRRFDAPLALLKSRLNLR